MLCSCLFSDYKTMNFIKLQELSFRFTLQILSLFSCQVWSVSFVIPLTVACQAPLSMGFLKQEHCSGWLFPSPEDLPNPAVKPSSPALTGDSSSLSHLGVILLRISWFMLTKTLCLCYLLSSTFLQFPPHTGVTSFLATCVLLCALRSLTFI